MDTVWASTSLNPESCWHVSVQWKFSLLRLSLSNWIKYSFFHFFLLGGVKVFSPPTFQTGLTIYFSTRVSPSPPVVLWGTPESLTHTFDKYLGLPSWTCILSETGIVRIPAIVHACNYRAVLKHLSWSAILQQECKQELERDISPLLSLVPC